MATGSTMDGSEETSSTVKPGFVLMRCSESGADTGDGSDWPNTGAASVSGRTSKTMRWFGLITKERGRKDSETLLEADVEAEVSTALQLPGPAGIIVTRHGTGTFFCYAPKLQH